jgi:hypothetical protein
MSQAVSHAYIGPVDTFSTNAAIVYEFRALCVMRQLQQLQTAVSDLIIHVTNICPCAYPRWLAASLNQFRWPGRGGGGEGGIP